MRTLLLIPPFFMGHKNFVKGMIFQPALGMASLWATLKREGMETALFDLSLCSWEEARDILTAHGRVDLTGISCVTGQHFNARRMSGLIRELKLSPRIVIGGGHATALPEQALRFTGADFAVVGEGEVTLLELAWALEAKGNPEDVPGMVIARKGDFIRTAKRERIKDLDWLPFPDFSIYDLDRFEKWLFPETNFPGPARKKLRKNAPRFLQLEASRGCPGRCTYCYQIFDTISFKSAKRVGDEIEYFYNNHGIRHIRFSDDNFTTNIKFTEEICDEIISRKLKITWDCGARVKPINENLLKKMKEAGCIRIGFGVPGGTESLLRRVNKKITKQDIRDTFRCVRKSGILADCTIMTGIPGESEETVDEMIALMDECNPYGLSHTIHCIFPQTATYNELVEAGKLADSYWEENMAPPLYTLEHSINKQLEFKSRIFYSHYKRRGELSRASREWLNFRKLKFKNRYFPQETGIASLCRTA